MPHADAPALDADPEQWLPYLRDRGLVGTDGATPVAVSLLSGGVSCVTVRVGDLVVKRPRERLAVAGYWPADTRRVLAEGAALARFPGLAPPLVDLDADQLTLTMGFVEGVNWKDELMGGRVDPEVGRRVGSALRTIHDTPLRGADGVDGLDGPEAAARFDELRLHPYFAGIPAAVPHAATAIEAMVGRLRSTRTHLVHGDFSPKNMLVRRPPSGVEITVLDWEVAGAGDPVFDLAFVLSHLLVKSVHLPRVRDDLIATGAALGDAYGPVERRWLGVVVGGLLLARVEGLSTLLYLDADERVTLREMGIRLVTEQEELPW